jgi:methanethiol S-methyltransferase
MLMLVAGLGLALGGLIRLKGLENIDRLVTGGIFAKLRHPMYTGFVLWILGWVIFYGAALSLMIGMLCAAGIPYWRRLEELRLEAQFGDAYRSYRKGTWF